MSRYADVAMSAVVLLIVSPVLVAIAATGALTSGTPIIYGSARQRLSASNNKELLAQE